MTEFMFVPVWLLLSWLVRQVEGGLDEDEIGEDAADPGEPYEPTVQIIKVGIAVFSLLLLALSITAYRKTALKGIVYAAIAFGLFSAQLFFDYLEDAVEGWEQPFNDVIFYAMTLAILVLFFLAIVRRGKTQKAL
jgi:hypothetical protein